MTYISVRKSRYSHSIISRSGEFVINLTNQDIAKKVDYCGVRSGRDVNKFDACSFTKLEADIVDAPLVAESPVNLECVVKDIVELPSHDMFIAEIVAVHADADLFDESGRLALDKANLVSYNHGHYFALKSKPLGRFGFSVMKPKTKKRLARRSEARRRKTSGHTKSSRQAKPASQAKSSGQNAKPSGRVKSSGHTKAAGQAKPAGPGHTKSSRQAKPSSPKHHQGSRKD